MFCSHKYEILETHKFEEKLTSVMQLTRQVNFTSEMFNTLSKQGVISVVKCIKCGNFKHIKTLL